MTSAGAVHVRGLSKAYGRVQAVQDLDLDVGYGEVVAILGPNGAGKSTTIEILEGNRKRDSGHVRVLGEDPGTAGRNWRARIGIVGMPELLFLDEPTTGFDPEARHQFWDLIRLLAKDGTTILLTTHYLEEASALADRVAVIASGRVVAVDSPARLVEHVNTAATVQWMDGGELHVERTNFPTELIRRRSRDGSELAQLTVTRPTLEDAYLHLIGVA